MKKCQIIRWIKIFGESIFSMNRYFRWIELFGILINILRYTPINEIKGRIINAISPGNSPRAERFEDSEDFPMSPSFEMKVCPIKTGSKILSKFLGSDEPDRKSGRKQMMHYLKPIYLYNRGHILPWRHYVFTYYVIFFIFLTHSIWVSLLNFLKSFKIESETTQVHYNKKNIREH